MACQFTIYNINLKTARVYCKYISFVLIWGYRIAGSEKIQQPKKLLADSLGVFSCAIIFLPE